MKTSKIIYYVDGTEEVLGPSWTIFPHEGYLVLRDHVTLSDSHELKRLIPNQRIKEVVVEYGEVAA